MFVLTMSLRTIQMNVLNKNIFKDCKREKSDEERKLWTVMKSYRMMKIVTCFFFVFFFLSNAFFQLSLNVAELFHEYKHHHSETFFILTIFLSMSRPGSNYVVSMSSIFHFFHHFHNDWLYNLMNTNALILLLIF